MASGITIKIKTRPLFVDYLKSIYKTEGHIILLHHTSMWEHVKHLLQLTPPNYKPREIEQNELAELLLPYTQEIDINYRNHISKNSEKIINTWLHLKFYTDIRDHIEKWKSIPGFDINKAILHFCDTHDINPDYYKVNSVYRDYYRYVQKKKSTEKLKKISSTFAAFLSIILHTTVLTLSYVL